MKKKRSIAGMIKWSFYEALPDRWLIVKQRNGEKQIFLTFDDGPNKKYTIPLIEILASYQVKAIFFLIGESAQKNPELVKKIVDAGHVLGNHSWDHKGFSFLGINEQMEQVRRTDEILYKFDGIKKHIFRPPGGLLSPRLFFELVKSRRQIVLWSTNSMDYCAKHESEICAVFDAFQIKNGEVLLFHDDNTRTLNAVTKLLPVWKNAGFKFKVTLS